MVFLLRMQKHHLIWSVSIASKVSSHFKHATFYSNCSGNEIQCVLGWEGGGGEEGSKDLLGMRIELFFEK